MNQSLRSVNNMLVPLVAAAIYFYSPGILYAAAAISVLAAVMLYAKIFLQNLSTGKPNVTCREDAKLSIKRRIIGKMVDSWGTVPFLKPG
ncbi:MAG: hypothetical protein ACXVJB_02495 [Mucilaginibacter sp.]